MRKFAICIVTVLLLLPVASALGCQQQTGTAVEHYERGVALYEEGHYEQAVSELDEAIELDPEYAWAYYYRAIVHIMEGDYDKATVDLIRALELDWHVKAAFTAG